MMGFMQGDLYGMVDTGWADPWRQIDLLATAGVTTLQLRCKGQQATWIAELGRAVQERWRAAELPLCLVINDHVEVARALGVMVHLGQADGLDPDIPFGRSTHDVTQARDPGRAVYIGFGPVFPSVTKAGAKTARGVEPSAFITQRLDWPPRSDTKAMSLPSGEIRGW